VPEPLLAVRGLVAGYGPMRIVDGVDLDVRTGDLLAIMGPNGAGKSTLLKTLFGMTTEHAGSIHLAGRPLQGRTSRERLAAGLAYVPQGRCNFPLMSVTENLQMALHAAAPAAVPAGIARARAMFPVLAARAGELAGNLSGGEQQMLEMAMAIVRAPRLLLLDEPTIGLAPAVIAEVFREIRGLHDAGVTVVVVEQNTRKAMEIATRAVVMRMGRIVYDGAAGLGQEALGALFLRGILPGGAHA
jgi:branched-chain amino acid transport system ATP-binding protein